MLGLLMKAENSFTPPLSHNIPYTINEYAERLSSSAMFVLCANGDEIVGFTAFYINLDGGFAYIPQIWVSEKYQRRGIGSSMIDTMIATLPCEIKSIRLEVRKNNKKACSFYEKSHYETIDERNGKFLMERKLGL